MAEPGPENYPSMDWGGIHLRLDKLYAGRPLSANAYIPRLTDNTVSVWRILSGRAVVEFQGLSAEAGPDEFIVCLPGHKYQRFDPETELFSLHFLLENGNRGGQWHGPHLAALSGDDELLASSNRLLATARRHQSCEDRYRSDQEFVLPLPAMLELQADVYQFCSRLVSRLLTRGGRLDPVSSRDARVADGIDWLHRQPASYKFNRAEFARLHHLSPSQLDRLWRRDLRVTPRQYWEELRIRRACKLLQSKSHSIKEAAFEMGFQHLSQFSSWFHAHKGESPREFRYRIERSS